MKTELLHFDVILIGRMDGDINLYHEFKYFKTELEESLEGLTVFNPLDFFEEMDTSGFENSDFLRVIVSHLAYVKCVVTLPGWVDDESCSSLVRIARQLKIHVLSSDVIKLALTNGTDWMPKDRN